MHIYSFWVIAGLATAFAVLLLLRPLAHGRIAFLIMCIVPVATLSLYLFLGRPDLTQWRTQEKMPPFIAASVDKLIQDTKDHPTDTEAWVLLGDVYGRVRRYGDAADAYRRAAFLDASNPAYKAMIGQALVMQDGGAVGGDAIEWFNQAKDDPTSRYYLALAKSQVGNWQEALADWQKLQQENPQGMSAAIEARIKDARAALGLDGH